MQKKKKSHITVNQACQSRELYDLFHLPLSEEAYVQFSEFSALLANLNLQEEPDLWSYI